MQARFISTTILTFSLLLLVVSACSQAGSNAADPLDGSSWVLLAYRDTGALAGSRVTLNFADGQVSGSGGCNSYGGSYQVAGDSLSVSELASTLMASLEPEGVMDQEAVFLGYLSDAQRFELGEQQLVIYFNGQDTLTFEPAS